MAVGAENSDFEVKAKYGIACHAVAYTGCEESKPLKSDDSISVIAASVRLKFNQLVHIHVYI